MSARLVVTSGPARGGSVALAAGEVTIGRDPGCGLCLPDATLSRRHAAVEPAGSGWLVRDLGSLNGIRVNGQPAGERVLSTGDRIELGGSVLVFDDGTGSLGVAALSPGTGAGEGSPTLRLPASQAIWTGRVPERQERPSARLETLLAATRRFGEARSEEELADALLGAALDRGPASAGAVLVTDGADGFRQLVARRRDERSAPIPVGQAAAVQALRLREAQVFVLAGGEAGASGNAGASGSRTGAAVPIVRGDEELGVLVLSSEGAPFVEPDLQLLYGLCASAATALAVVRHVAWLEGERHRLAAALEVPGDEMIGASPAMQRVRERIVRAAASDATVLLLGESGTGKELAARALHARSARRDGPFVAVNAAALVETLVESELFGHERGAFTGAIARRRGKLEAAHKGTLFLDEVGEMSPAAQAKLLRVLETREVERVGGSGAVRVDVRVVAATNRDLAELAKAGRFREDLFYRLNVVTLEMPPLRSRREDVPALASFFLARFRERLGKRFDGFSPAALARLCAYSWPGNVRELANAVERAAVLSEGGALIRPEDLPEALLEGPGPAAAGDGLGPYHEAVNRAKREAVEAAMAHSGGNVTEAARLLGLHPNYLHRLLNQLGLRNG